MQKHTGTRDAGGHRDVDYVVVGAGSAGCALAARLSQNARVSVLLLEAGPGERLKAVAVPPAWPGLLGTEMDWADVTVPQSAADGARVSWPRGRGLGGSSAINAMNFLRGHRSGYDAWAAGGAPGWGFDDLLPFFRRSENVGATPHRDPSLRGSAGPLRVGPADPGHPLAEACLSAAAERGHPLVRDPTAGVEVGFGWGDLSIADGRRRDAYVSYLRPALDRDNLTVVTDALVLRLLMEGSDCVGVEYAVGGRTVAVRCSREVVLTAGTIGSAHLLMLSGIGDADHLRGAGVPVTVHLPGVGANLHDHPVSGVVHESARPVPPAVNNHGEVQGLLHCGPHATVPDVQIQSVDVPLRADGLPGPGPGGGYTVMVSLMAPFSRGTVRLAGASPATRPLVDPRYYTDPRDLDTMTRGLLIAQELASARALRPWRGKEVLPGHPVTDGADARAYLRSNLRAYHHCVGTCRIGVDDAAVVDPDLRVHGVRGLRVADASVMPSIPTANPNATVYAIAERAADLLRRTV